MAAEDGPRLVVTPLVTRRSKVDVFPPPPSMGVSRAFLRMHRALTSMFGRRLLRLWGQFVGTYSAFAYAACARGRRRERPAPCGFPTEARVGRSGASACPVHADAVALIKVLQGVGGVISTSAEMTTGRLRKRATPGRNTMQEEAKLQGHRCAPYACAPINYLWATRTGQRPVPNMRHPYDSARP